MLFNNSLIGSTFIKQITWEGTETEGKKIGQAAALEKLTDHQLCCFRCIRKFPLLLESLLKLHVGEFQSCSNV